jgi:NDP-sugar pyrophosphorylase family protein
MKDKIAISLDRDTLEKIDKRIDGTNIRSRSQAIEVLLRKGLMQKGTNTGILMLSKAHAVIPQKKFKGSTVLENQLSLFKKHGIENVYIVTQENIVTDKAMIIKTKEKNNGDAIMHARIHISGNFVVMSGDVYNLFDLSAMIEKHVSSGKLATIGLMSSAYPDKYGIAVLEGDLVVDFVEKPKNPESNIVNAGVYVFSPEAFDLLKGSIEKDVLPELARKRQLVCYFTMGEYVHFGRTEDVSDIARK